MKLDCVLTAVNENPLYIDFIPLFIKYWNKLYPQVDIKIIFIANKIPDNIISYSNNIILFEPLKNISTSFISQYIRILYPSILNYDNGVLISDIDMMPMNRTYYTENIKLFEEDKFIYYRDAVCFNFKQIAMCYNVANPKIWSDIFKINTLNDIKKRLIDINNSINYIDGHGNQGWSTDQLDLYKYVMEWNKTTNNLICLKENNTKFCRLDRHRFLLNNETIINNIKNGVYTDYHCYRPYNKYKEINDKIYELL